MHLHRLFPTGVLGLLLGVSLAAADSTRPALPSPLRLIPDSADFAFQIHQPGQLVQGVLKLRRGRKNAETRRGRGATELHRRCAACVSYWPTSRSSSARSTRTCSTTSRAAAWFWPEGLPTRPRRCLCCKAATKNGSRKSSAKLSPSSKANSNAGIEGQNHQGHL